MNAFLSKIVAWVTAGYPEGVPGPDRVPLMSLLNRRLGNDEVKAVAEALMNLGEFDHIAGIAGDLLNLEYVIGGNAILLAARFDDREHRFHPRVRSRCSEDSGPASFSRI